MEFDPVAYLNDPRWSASNYGLDRIRELLERIGRPQDKLKFVHVSGTNGKGSIVAFLGGILTAAGYKVGTFSSPAIMEYKDQVRVDGVVISTDELRVATEPVREAAEAMAARDGLEGHPTQFELLTAATFQHFVNCGCDIAIIECGMGGLEDSTNVIDAPEVCVFARMGLDHTGFLGDTLAKIATNKAGIMKQGASVVSWPQVEEAMEVLEQRASEIGTVAITPDFDQVTVGHIACDGRRSFTYRGVQYLTSLLGSYQPYNAAVAIEAAGALKARGWHIEENAQVLGIESALLPGRFEILPAREGRGPVVVDGGHNPQGAAVLVDSLHDRFPGRRIVFALGILADKDYREMLLLFAPLASAWVCITPPNPRALPAADMAKTVTELVGDDVIVQVADGFEDAAVRALALAGPDGVVCACGSLYSVSSWKKAFEA